LATTTRARPNADRVAVATSDASGEPPPGLRRNGPASDSVVITAAVRDRSTMRARRRTIVKTTTSDSPARSSRPVKWPVRM